MVGVGGFRVETSLPPVDQAFLVFFKTRKYWLSYRTPLFRILITILFFQLLGKTLSYLRMNRSYNSAETGAARKSSVETPRPTTLFPLS